MSEVLRQLFESSDPKAFAKLFKAGEEEWKEPPEFIRRVAAELPACLYEKYYDDLVPHSFFGLSCAASTLGLFPEERLWWPCVQQGWLIANSRRRTPWNGAGAEPPAASREERWKQFEEAAERGSFEGCQELSAAFLAEAEEREFFRARTLARALDDTAHGGLKFVQLNQAWKLAESLNWDGAALALFPALHFLVVGPSRDKLAAAAAGAGPVGQARGGRAAVDEAALEEFQAAVLYSEDPAAALAALGHLAEPGHTWEALHEALLLTAVQALNNAQIGRWLPPVRALLYTEACRDLERPEAKEHGLVLAALLIQEASRKSRESDEPRRVVDMARTVCPTDPFGVLRSLVSHSDPYASANTVQAILGMGEESHRELVETLATLAAKNDARIGQGYDLLLVKTCAEAHGRSESDLKDRFLVGCAFFLGRLLKDYELFGAYGV